MAITLRGVHALQSFSGTEVTATLPVTTNTGDTIVIVLYTQPNTGQNFAALGAGATWTVIAPAFGGNIACAVFIGRNASSGDTTALLTWSPIQTGYISTGVFSGLSTTVGDESTVSAGPGATGAAVTTGTITYTAGDLLIGAGGTFTWNANAAQGSFSAESAQAGQKTNSSDNRSPMWDYAITTATSTTYTTPVAASGQTAVAIVVAIPVLASPNNSGFFAVM